MMTSFTGWLTAWIVQNYIQLSVGLITVGFFIGWHMRLEDGPEQMPDSSADQPD
jgi:hypothetical protein